MTLSEARAIRSNPKGGDIGAYPLWYLNPRLFGMEAMRWFIRFQLYGLRILSGPITIIIPQPSQVDAIIEHRLLP